MKRLTGLALVAAAVFAALAAAPSPANARSKIFKNPKINGKLLDGCYSWPGPCNEDKQADAFCVRKGYEYADDYDTENKAGLFQTKRLGDKGVCTSSCTVMKRVECTDGDDEG